MLNNSFIKRYKSIPIARYNCCFPASEQVHIEPPLENHREFEIILIKSGCANVYADNECFIANAGDILLFSPYMLHSLEIPSGCSFEHICHCFDLSLVLNPALSAQLEQNSIATITHIKAETPHNKSVAEFFLCADEALKTHKPYWEMVVRGNLSLLFAYLMQNNLLKQTSVRTRETKFCLRVLEYLEKHYKENLTSAEVARDLFYNQSYFCRLFKKNFGLCFSEYLILFRLNKAKYMLEDKTLSITDIAYETGFSTASYFIKVFHRENGVTPKRFREINF